MSRFNEDNEDNSNMFNSGWFKALKIPPLKDIDYDHNLFTLKPLSDEPFDILKCIDNEGSDNSAPASDPASVNDQHEEERQQQMDYQEEEEEDIWTSYTTPTTFNTLSWDTQNRHFPSFAQTQLAKNNIGTPFITEAPISLFDPMIQARSNTPDKVVAESQLVKSLIQAMVGLPSIYFYWQSDEFKIRTPYVRILGVSTIAVLPVLKEILKFGTQLRAIENVAHVVKRNPDHYGLTGVAMACCLSELHLNMQHQAISVFEKEEKVTILKVHQYVGNLAVVTERLYKLCSIRSTTGEMTTAKRNHIGRYGFYLPFGVELINMLHEEVRKFDLAQSGNHALYRDICLSMLCYTSVPYLSMLSKWLGLDKDYSGVVDDPYDEFFISTSVQIQDILERFQIRPDTTLPYFISPEMAIYIFRSGISLQLLRKTKPNHPIFDMSDSIPLKCLLKNMESDEYMTKLDTICKYIQAYNSGTNGEQPPAIPDIQQQQQQQQDDTPMNDDLIPRLTFLDPMIDLKGDFLTTLTELIEHDQQPNNFIPTLDTITYQSYTHPLHVWCPLLNESFMSSFLHQFKLQSHLSLLYNYFLFGNGTFVTGLKTTFFKSDISLSHIKSWPPKSYDLNMALRDLLLEQEDQDVFTFSIREPTESSAWLNPNAVEALNFLELNYYATYPLNIVITPTILTNYNRIFTFLLQILRASTVTKRMFEPLKSMRWFRTQTGNKISQYRFRMDQFMSALQGYVHDTAIYDTWFRFMQHVKEMHFNQPKSDYVSVIMEPHTFKEYHEHVLDRILYQCFLKQSQLRILSTLLPVLNCVILLGVVLDDYTELDMAAEHLLYLKCRKVFDLFQKHARTFIAVLKNLEEKGSGRLSNLLNSTKHSIFNDLYARHEAKNGVDVFVKDLLVRLSLNDFYK